MSQEPEDDDLLPEYDFSNAVRGKYYERYQAGTNVRLDGIPPPETPWAQTGHSGEGTSVTSADSRTIPPGFLWA